MGVWAWLEKRFSSTPLHAHQRPASPNGQVGASPVRLQERPTLIGTDLQEVEEQLRQELRDCSDIVFRRLTSQGGLKALLLFVDGLISAERLERDLVTSLLYRWPPADVEGTTRELQHLRTCLAESLVPTASVTAVQGYADLLNRMLTGEAALVIDGLPGALMLSYKEWKARPPERPISEEVVRGPREGFTESIRINTALLRRRIRSTALKMESLVIGEVTRSDIVMAYLRNVTSPGLVGEVLRRLKRIQIDGILESGYIEEFLEDAPFSPFSQIQSTERPDVVAAALLEGRVAVLTDGTPFALIMPVTFFTLMQANEDHYERYLIGTFIRWLRYILFFISLTLPALYVAITTFHPEMIPTNLLVTIAAAREGIPFPAVLEALFMEAAFEALREAGLRLPAPVGQAVSIVGALVIGQAAVQAGIVSTPAIIVVSATGIASFTAPHYYVASPVRLLRFPLMLMGASLGLFGVTAGLLGILIHLCSLRSFGIPYMAPLVPLSLPDLKDTVIRAPRWAMQRRPAILSRQNPHRMPPAQGRRLFDR